MRTLHLVVAAPLVLLAGCAAFVPGTPTAADDSPTGTRAGPDTRAGTATPTPSASRISGTTSDEYPPATP
ncbi:hypothetical protein [Halorientalis marina]|uniref:hypothetical protein n=1 Tax=Halorientalis marina TaxID=2931976 RepID=UPI001FF590CA|nr:hypothetical protein [Halorientalis marina]